MNPTCIHAILDLYKVVVGRVFDDIENDMIPIAPDNRNQLKQLWIYKLGELTPLAERPYFFDGFETDNQHHATKTAIFGAPPVFIKKRSVTVKRDLFLKRRTTKHSLEKLKCKECYDAAHIKNLRMIRKTFIGGSDGSASVTAANVSFSPCMMGFNYSTRSSSNRFKWTWHLESCMIRGSIRDFIFDELFCSLYLDKIIDVTIDASIDEDTFFSQQMT